MQFFKIFSKRRKQERDEVPDPYQYDAIPSELRVQVFYIWEAIFGKIHRNPLRHLEPFEAVKAYENIYENLCFQYGVLGLVEPHNSNTESLHTFFLSTEEAAKAIDVIELSFKYIDEYVRNHLNRFRESRISPDQAIAVLNNQFQEHRVGYRYESGQIVRIDSEFIHSEAMVPVMKMLSNPMYEGANDEFLSAHKHYQKSRYKECINECLKAFESCIKSICDARGWGYSDRATAKNLIDIVFKNKLIPDSMQSHFSGLRSTLETVATLRNDQSAHGQGSTVTTVPEYIATYTLHLTASNILFLAKANEEMG